MSDRFYISGHGHDTLRRANDLIFATKWFFENRGHTRETLAYATAALVVEIGRAHV